jgi:8-oxo-dGTP diphosphatase
MDAVGIIRRVSVLILYNDKKEILLQHRTKDAPRLPDHWAFFGGGAEEEENKEEALSREILEELEYRVNNPVHISTINIIHENTTIIKHIFIEKYDLIQKLILHEGQGMAWWRFEELHSLLIADHDREALADAQNVICSK